MRPVAVLLACLAPILAACGADPEPTPPSAGVVSDGPEGGSAAGSGGGDGGAPPRRRRAEFDPLGEMVRCLEEDDVPARRIGRREVRIGDDATGVRAVLLSTEAETQTRQLQGRAEGAEVLGRLLLYVGRGSDAFLARVEPCAVTAGRKE